jgi:hypothetical protein
MSFFLKSVKNKAQRLNIKRKAPTTTQVANAPASQKKQKYDLNEEIPSDTDEEIIE